MKPRILLASTAALSPILASGCGHGDDSSGAATARGTISVWFSNNAQGSPGAGRWCRPGMPPIPFSDAKNVALYTACTKRATAWDFLKFSTSIDQDGKLLAMTGQMPALADTAAFTPRLLTATGPINGGLPAPIDNSPIAYGADARVQSLLSVARATGSAGLRQLAGVAAGWFFGQNPAGVPMYDPGYGSHR